MAGPLQPHITSQIPSEGKDLYRRTETAVGPRLTCYTINCQKITGHNGSTFLCCCKLMILTLYMATSRQASKQASKHASKQACQHVLATAAAVQKCLSLKLMCGPRHAESALQPCREAATCFCASPEQKLACTLACCTTSTH